MCQHTTVYTQKHNTFRHQEKDKYTKKDEDTHNIRHLCHNEPNHKKEIHDNDVQKTRTTFTKGQSLAKREKKKKTRQDKTRQATHHATGDNKPTTRKEKTGQDKIK